MKRKFFSYLAAFAVILTATSCSQDEPGPDVNNEEAVEVSFSGKLPAGVRSRANDTSVCPDGDPAPGKFYAAVYTGNTLVQQLTYDETQLPSITKDGKFQVSFKLKKSVSYRIFFIAHEKSLDGVLSVDLTNHTLTVSDFMKLYKHHLNKGCAWIANCTITPTENTLSEDVQMKSTFAQVALITNQIDQEFYDEWFWQGIWMSYGKKDDSTVSLPKTLDYLTDKITEWATINTNNVFGDCHKLDKDNGTLTDGYFTLFEENVLAPVNGSESFTPVFHLYSADPTPPSNPMIRPQTPVVYPLSPISIKANTRYVYVDNGDGGTGGLFSSEPDIKLEVKDDITNNEPEEV